MTETATRLNDVDIAAVGQGLRDAAVAVMSGDAGTTP